MRPSPPSILLAVCIALLPASGGAWGKEAGEKPPARMKLPPLSAPRPDLRGALSPTPPVRAASPARLNDPALRPLQSQGVAAAGLGVQPLVGLRSTLDPAPQCRADCARARYFCATGSEDAGCNDRWGQCVLGCRSLARP